MVGDGEMQFTGRLLAKADWLGGKVGGHWSALFLHSSRERSELSQCCEQDDSTVKIIMVTIISIFYVAAKARYIRLLHGKMGFFGGFFGPSSVKWGRTHIVLG